MGIAPECPGQDRRNIKVENVTCVNCGYQVEMFSDEMNVRCPKCKEQVCRQRLPSCVDWCAHARECVGEQRWKQLKGGQGGGEKKDH
ncbi:MAG: phosphohydrolase [Candidatus Omnitrophota bacterium]